MLHKPYLFSKIRRYKMINIVNNQILQYNGLENQIKLQTLNTEAETIMMKKRDRFRLISKVFMLTTILIILIAQGSLPLQRIATVWAASSSETIKMNKASVTVSVGKTVKLDLTGTSKAVIWKTSNRSIATVSKKGTVKGIKDGTATITAVLGTKEYTCKVTVQDVIAWKDPSVEAIVRQALGKETGEITKKEAAAYTNWMILYRDDIKTIEDLVWFKNMSTLIVRADLLTDASILPADLHIRLFFNGINKPTDIIPLCNFSEINKFKHQGVIMNQRAEDMYFFGNENISLEYKNEIEDFSDLEVLKKFKNLEYLDLSSNAINDLNFIGCLSDVKTLSQLILAYNNISDISILKNFTALQELYLQHNLVEDIRPLGKLKYLKRIALNENRLTDISSLSKLLNLETIELGYNNIEDISCLKGLNPSYVDIKYNKIVELDCFEKMSKLSYLDLSMNNISDVSSLKNLHATATLWLLGNPVTDWTPVSHIKNVLGRGEK